MFLRPTRLLSLLALLIPATSLAFDPKNIELKDPTGDDKGPGSYTYPTDPAYKKGSFDLTRLSIKDKGADLEFTATMNAAIEDPWNSKSWGGNGFSLQMIQVYIDSKKGGRIPALPGINVKFEKGHGWDKVVFISPQPKSKIISEVKTKEKKALPRIVVPVRTYARGREIVAIVKKSDLGGGPTKTWGFQAIVQSNEGYPDKDSVLARKVNEYNGQHRFGGGNDYNCDPHVIDMLAPPAKGSGGEKDAQYKVLKKYTCDGAGKGKKAVIPMVYPGK